MPGKEGEGRKECSIAAVTWKVACVSTVWGGGREELAAGMPGEEEEEGV